MDLRHKARPGQTVPLRDRHLSWTSRPRVLRDIASPPLAGAVIANTCPRHSPLPFCHDHSCPLLSCSISRPNFFAVTSIGPVTHPVIPRPRLVLNGQHQRGSLRTAFKLHTGLRRRGSSCVSLYEVRLDDRLSNPPLMRFTLVRCLTSNYKGNPFSVKYRVVSSVLYTLELVSRRRRSHVMARI